jgi:glycosyltransferase involved in cell wall biosynthesis
VRFLTVGNRYGSLGGYEQMWAAVVVALRARGHEVDVLSPEHGLRWYWRDHRWPRFMPWTVRSIERHNREAFSRAAAGSDLVSFWSMGGLSLSLLSMPARSIAVIHDEWPVYGPRVDKAFRGSLELPPSFFVSEYVRDGRPGEVVPSGYDERVFTPAEPRPWSGRLLLPGRVDARKGHRTALAAFGSGFVVAGSGEEALERELRGAGVEMLGRLAPPELAEEYARADAVLFPVGWNEPWGLVPLEAMAVGRPVVATGTGGSGEYLVHEENCLLVPAGDAEARRAAVERLAGDEALRSRLREGGFATAARHTLSRFVERMVDVHETYASRC